MTAPLRYFLNGAHDPWLTTKDENADLCWTTVQHERDGDFRNRHYCPLMLTLTSILHELRTNWQTRV